MQVFLLFNSVINTELIFCWYILTLKKLFAEFFCFVYLLNTSNPKTIILTVAAFFGISNSIISIAYTFSPGNMWIYLEQIATVLKHTFSYP